MIKINIENLKSPSQKERAADYLLEDAILIVTGVATVGAIKVSPQYGGFSYGVYDLDAHWNQDEGTYDESCLRDGGICQEGDVLDAINHFYEMMYFLDK